MPIQKLEDCPFVYEIQTVNERGQINNVRTNLYFLGKILKEMNKGFSPMILIVGRQRMGKSFVGMLLSYMIMKSFRKEDDFRMEDHCFYEARKMIKSIQNAVLVTKMLDEAGAIMGRREWFEQTHRALEKVIQTQGYKTIAYIFVSPFATDIDKVFLKHFDFIVRVEYRGKIKVFKTVKKYDETNDKKIIKYFMDEMVYNLSDLPTEIWDNYEKFSFEQKEILRKKYENHDKSNDKLANTVISRLKSALSEGP